MITTFTSKWVIMRNGKQEGKRAIWKEMGTVGVFHCNMGSLAPKARPSNPILEGVASAKDLLYNSKLEMISMHILLETALQLFD